MFLAAVALSGCPQFPGCPEPPALDIGIPSPAIVGVWTGDGDLPDRSRPPIYQSTIDFDPDGTFSMVIVQGDAGHQVVGTWAVNPLAIPQPRIQLGVACSDFDFYPPSSWLRGVYLTLDFGPDEPEVLVMRLSAFPTRAIIGVEDDPDGWPEWTFERTQ
jgi:hypothetical protein